MLKGGLAFVHGLQAYVGRHKLSNICRIVDFIGGTLRIAGNIFLKCWRKFQDSEALLFILQDVS